MKNFKESILVGPLIGLYLLIKIVFPFTAVITHLWTVYIAFKESGIFGGLLTLTFPVISEFYWVYRMWDINETFVWIAMAHIILAFPAMIFSENPAGSPR